ncbi:MAG: PqqD family protein [Halanaerobiales bacterium]|nr:PqqD family protein [Halanaerobiales bacterium]
MKLTKKEKFKWILREDGGYIYDYSTGTVKVLNDTGSFIIQKCEKNSITDIVNDLLNTFEIDDPHQAEEDVNSFLRNMIEEGYLCQEK